MRNVFAIFHILLSVDLIFIIYQIWNYFRPIVAVAPVTQQRSLKNKLYYLIGMEIFSIFCILCLTFTCDTVQIVFFSLFFLSSSINFYLIQLLLASRKKTNNFDFNLNVILFVLSIFYTFISIYCSLKNINGAICYVSSTLNFLLYFTFPILNTRLGYVILGARFFRKEVQYYPTSII